MINQIVCYIVKKLSPYSKEKDVVLFYGIEIMIYTILSTICLIIIGIIFNELIFSVIIIALFYINQTFGGGYHASSHSHCCIIMVVFLSIGLLLCRVMFNTILLAGISIVALVVLLLNPCVLHPNKYYLRNKKRQYVCRSRCIIGIEMMLTVALYVFQRDIIRPFTIGLLFSTLSRLVGKNVYKSYYDIKRYH